MLLTKEMGFQCALALALPGSQMVAEARQARDLHALATEAAAREGAEIARNQALPAARKNLIAAKTALPDSFSCEVAGNAVPSRNRRSPASRLQANYASKIAGSKIADPRSFRTQYWK